MLQNLNATKKGLMTGGLMIGLSLIFFYSGQSLDGPLQYSIYIVYAAGIIWSLYDFSRSAENTNKFGTYFLQGFKCFIVVTLLMVIFTFVFNKMHPEFKEQMGATYRDELFKNENITPAEVVSNVEKMKEFYLTMLISRAIFGYLLTGSVITLVSSFLFMRRK
ncbi:MAG: DUF4199 domain-containing protein [Ferruginibacter sp.]